MGTGRCAEQVVLDQFQVSRTLAHVELADSGRAHLLRVATNCDGWLVEMHSHGRRGDPAEFSSMDMDGLAAWVAHLQWRLPGRGYVAVVVGEETVDGLVWLPNASGPRPLTALQTSANASWKTTERSYANWIEDAR